jgi:hypothetical protein
MKKSLSDSKESVVGIIEADDGHVGRREHIFEKLTTSQ